MSDDTITECPLALTPEDLSRFRDGDLSSSRAHELEDHLATCAACRARLAEYVDIGSGLRAIPEPALDDSRFWREVEARARDRRPARSAGRVMPRHTFAGLGAVAAMLLVAMAFVQLFASRGGSTARVSSTATASPSATSAPTATVAPAHPVTWRQLSFPDAWPQSNGAGVTPSAGGGVPYASAILGFTAADPNILYACVSPQNATSTVYTIWTSRDRGVTWARAGSIPSRQPAQCKIIVDSTDARNAIVRLSWYEPGASPMQPSGNAFATDDGGQTFTALSGNYDYAQMASFRGKVYVLRLAFPGDASQGYRLMVSSDGMRSWSPGDQTIADASATISAFWLNAANGSILVYAFSGSDRSFWVSPDGGRQWRQLSNPGNGLLKSIAVQWPLATEPWRICVAGQSLDAPPAEMHNQLACTLDGGKTWISHPALDITLTCNCLKGSPFTSISALQLVGIAPDGSLLATVLDRYDGDNPHLGLYRLPPNATAWQSIGDAGDASANTTTFLLPSGVLWKSGWQPLNQASFWIGALYVSTATYP